MMNSLVRYLIGVIAVVCLFCTSAFACPSCPVDTTQGWENYSALSAGDVVTNQLKYFDVAAQGASGKAMIFNSNCSGTSCSGGDSDLGVWLGNLIIISEDGDSNDPDDATSGGTLTLTFHSPTLVRSLKVVDVEEGARIKVFRNGNEVFNKYVTSYNKQVKRIYIEKNHQLVEADKITVKFNGSAALGPIELCADDDKCLPEIEVDFECDEVDVTSTKDLSNVVLEFCDGTADQKFDGLSGYTGTFAGTGSNVGKNIKGVWVKSGCNASGDGPGYGEYFANPYGCQCEYDCLGVPNGDAVVDDCGVCDGNNRDKDECGVCFGPGQGECGCDLSIVKDDCGVCGGSNEDKGCDGVCFSGKVEDSCGVCGGSGPGECGCDLSVTKDDCGVCGGHNEDKGCDGVCFSGRVVDECGVCDGPGKNECNSCDPSYMKDACGVCGGDNSSCAGCDMVPWSGKVFDECGVCDGDGSTCADCAGVPNGDAEYDDCGVCEGDGTSCEIQICYAEYIAGGPQRFPATASIITIKDYQKPEYLKTGLIGGVELCDLITICYETGNGKETKEIAKLVLPIYEVNGRATLGDCIFDGLEPYACAEVNGFLNQTNIASVINRTNSPISLTVSYTDLFGVEKGKVPATIGPFVKQDFIVDEMGLELDTYGTVCVDVDTDRKGVWYGGITTYKPEEQGVVEDFDFALYYPFVNPKKTTQYAPLNNFRLGASVVANWIRITDAVRDGKSLTGLLEFFDDQGVKVDEQAVYIPDAGRFDYAGHTGLGGPDSLDGVGFAKFTPSDDSVKFYFTTSRYFYHCFGYPRGSADCNNFLGGFVIPDRSPINGTSYGTVTTKDSTMSVVELNNTSDTDAMVTLEVYNAVGTLKGREHLYVASMGTTHFIINGLLNQEVGHAKLTTNGHSVAVSTYVYNLDSLLNLILGFGTPFTDVPADSQMSEFNSFIQQRNVYELSNVTDTEQRVTVDVLDYQGSLLSSLEANLPARSSLRSDLVVAPGTYGTLVLEGNGVIFRNFVTKTNEYVLPFAGR